MKHQLDLNSAGKHSEIIFREHLGTQSVYKGSRKDKADVPPPPHPETSACTLEVLKYYFLLSFSIIDYLQGMLIKWMKVHYIISKSTPFLFILMRAIWREDVLGSLHRVAYILYHGVFPSHKYLPKTVIFMLNSFQKIFYYGEVGVSKFT